MPTRFDPRERGVGFPFQNLVSSWLKRSMIKGVVQRGTITITGATTGTATITSIDPNNSRLRFLGATSTDNTLTAPKFLTRLTLTNATTITATLVTSPGASSVVISFEITEYFPGVIRSIQRGTITDPTTTATINAVDVNKSEIDNLGNTSATGVFNDAQFARVVLTNATTVTATIGVSDSQVTAFQVVEWW